MAISGFGIPLGFRYIFAQINYPNAIDLAMEGFKDLARVTVFFNPVYLPLIMHTWFGAMSIGGFIVASFFAIRGNTNVKFVWIGLWHGVVFLILQAFMGPWYLVTLSAVTPILFNNLVGAIDSTLNILPAFAAKMIMVASLALVSVKVWSDVKRGNGEVPRYALVLGPMAVVAAMIGEFMNDGGRYPFMVLEGQTGIGAAQFMNVYLEIPVYTVYGVVAILLAFVGVFMATAYYALNRRFLADMPDGFAEHM
jgi:cytochrome d ubiquinol oxidase subunit I